MSTLQQTMVAEAQTVQQFVDLLKLEQTSLSRGDTDSLAAYADQKIKFAGELNSLATQRNAALAQQGLAADGAGVEAWCAQHPDQGIVAQAWSTVLSLATEARQLNNMNGRLIALRMSYNAKALEALRGGNNSLNLYGPDGQSKTANHRRITDAV